MQVSQERGGRSHSLAVVGSRAGIEAHICNFIHATKSYSVDLDQSFSSNPNLRLTYKYEKKNTSLNLVACFSSSSVFLGGRVSFRCSFLVRVNLIRDSDL